MPKWWLLTPLFLFSATPVFATRSLSITTTDKTSLIGDEVVTITASPSGFIDGETIYIKGAFYQDGTTTKNYFGYTQKGDIWIKNSQTTTDQLSVKMGEWDNILKIKSDFNDSGYKGEGDYKVAVGFYYVTSTGNNSSVNWSSNTQTVTINEPDPTPTSTSTPTPLPSPTSSLVPTPQPTATKPAPTTTLRPYSSPTPSSIPISPSLTLAASSSSEIAAVLAAETTSIPIPPVTPTKNFPWVAGIFVGLGLIFLAVSIGIYFHSRKDS